MPEKLSKPPGENRSACFDKEVKKDWCAGGSQKEPGQG